MRIDRRRFLTVLGLGGLAAGLPSLGWNAIAAAGETPPPKRLVIWIQGHGTVPRAWNLGMPGAPADRVATADFASRTLDETPEILRPLDAHRRKLLCIEGLAQSTLFDDHVRIASDPTLDPNEHNLAMAHLLTTTPSLQVPGQRCLGGGASIDQVIGQRTREGSRWASRLYGADHFLPYSFVEAGRATPRVDTPRQAFADMMGIYVPPEGTTPREDLIRAGRGSVLDLVSSEYDYASARLGTEGRRKLEQHAALVRDLERSFGDSVLAPQCALELDDTGHEIDQWNRITAMLLACDMTRVVTVVTPVITPPDFGYPAEPDLHGGYAHSSFDDGSEPFQERSELAMIEYNKWYANRFASLLTMLDAIPEGTGSLLDHANVLWLTELATGTHAHVNVPIVVAGGGDGFFRTGSYVRYPRDVPCPWAPRGAFEMGPSLSRLYVTLMRAMGLPDESFGQESMTLADGSSHSLRGTLAETHF
jgi:hypothetical protein